MVDRDWRGSFGDLVAVVGDYVGTFARAAMTWKRYDDYMARSIGQLARYAMEDVRECAWKHRKQMEAGMATPPRKTRDLTQSERRWLAAFMGAV